MSSKHTPGPWHLGALPPSGKLYICDNDGETVAAVAEWEPNGQIHMIYKNADANADFIAAAPETAAERDKLKISFLDAVTAISEKGQEIDTLKAINAELLAVVALFDAHWSEDFPGGPDTKAVGATFTDETIEIWRKARDALANAKSAS